MSGDQKLAAGTRLYWVPTVNAHHRNPEHVEVISVGRRWAYITEVGRRPRDRRIEIDSLREDGKGHTSPGRCYWSEGEFKAQGERQKAWSGVQQLMQGKYSPPEGVTTEAIITATNLLRGPSSVANQEPSNER